MKRDKLLGTWNRNRELFEELARWNSLNDERRRDYRSFYHERMALAQDLFNFYSFYDACRAYNHCVLMYTDDGFYVGYTMWDD